MSHFNEDSRVKIPTILHLMRLGYEYLSLKGAQWDKSTNIFTDIFNESIQRINPELSANEIKRLYDEVSLSLENEDIGRAFFEKLIDTSGDRLIDFANFDNNSFHVVTELTYENGDDEFRPDIILLINGMPLVFIEVKKPNNKNGVLAEQKRIVTRFQNKKFRKFVNLTQLMVFSNNMEYDDDSPLPIEGAFYATASYAKPQFNYFREEETFDLTQLLADLDDSQENFVLQDTNYLSIKNSPEFLTNKNPDTPTNRICTSLFQRGRLAFILQYAFAYVKESKGLQKHIMRYPQMFATKAIESKLEQGVKKGIIWHTQGSGKTALAYYNVKHLTAYYQRKGIIPKFYFIVDRLDLLTQAEKEFKARSLVVHTINSREKFAEEIKSKSAVNNHSGKAEITVVNIQKFQDDPDVVQNCDYQINIQRVFFMDEVHRSYNPEGSFLANLEQADKNAIKIGLTGTPLIGDTLKSRDLFGDYIHKYYYNSSIKDGYTLRLIREEIDTSYKLTLQKTLDDIKVLKGNADKKSIYAHRKFVDPMLDYIVKDYQNAQIAMNDKSIGAMVICDSSEQAKEMFAIFKEKYGYAKEVEEIQELMVAEESASYNASPKDLRAELILHDIGDKDYRKELVDEFKEGKVDFLFVFNMLLTGFDAPRLKKLYIGRMVKAHNLLQALTRVNRTYKDFRYGYVVDFADIQKEFEKTNEDYFKELQSELGDDLESYSDLFKTPEEIAQEIAQIKESLFHFDTENAEIFSQQISQINDHGQMQQIIKSLNTAKSLYNLIRLSGNTEMLKKLDFRKLTILSREANNHMALINAKEVLDSDLDNTNLLNVALEDVIFAFTKVKEEEMLIADQLKNTLQKTREGLGGNFDPLDPEFISLREELERLFKKKNLNEVTKEEMEANIKALEEIHRRSRELHRKNELLKAKYDNDEKYARLHKRLMEKDPLTDSESKLFEALKGLKEEADQQILQKSKVLENENYVAQMMLRMVASHFNKKQKITNKPAAIKHINAMVVKEYMNEFYGINA